jgi:hypothetical protein
VKGTEKKRIAEEEEEDVKIYRSKKRFQKTDKDERNGRI